MCDDCTSRPAGGETSTREGAICNYTNKRNPSSLNEGYITKKYDLLSVAADVLKRDPGFDWRTAGCMNHMISGNVNIYQSQTENGSRGHFGGLMACGALWLCPVCAAKIAAKRAEEVQLIIERSGCTPLFLTWTNQHHLEDFLNDVLNNLKEALHYTRQGAARKRLYKALCVVGYIRVIEVRYGFKNGWHPHAHEVLLIDLPPEEIDVEEVKQVLSKRYYKWLRDNGYYVNEDHTIDVRLCYPSKDETIAEAAAKYLTKSSLHLEMTEGQEKENLDSKSLSPFQILDMYQSTGDSRYADLFLEYAKATKGKRQMTFSRGLKKKYLIEDKTDEELVNEQTEDATLICSLDRENWRKVLDKHLRAQVLVEAALRAESLIQWLAQHGIVATIPEVYEEIEPVTVMSDEAMTRSRQIMREQLITSLQEAFPDVSPAMLEPICS